MSKTDIGILTAAKRILSQPIETIDEDVFEWLRDNDLSVEIANVYKQALSRLLKRVHEMETQRTDAERIAWLLANRPRFIWPRIVPDEGMWLFCSDPADDWCWLCACWLGATETPPNFDYLNPEDEGIGDRIRQYTDAAMDRWEQERGDGGTEQ